MYESGARTTLPCATQPVNYAAAGGTFTIHMKPALTFGIAGHVDHGKTSLVRALTGQETDRLGEEKRRGISIELGFAFLDVPVPGRGEVRIGIVDMPGHEKFVRRMIAGTAGIDAVVMVVAADEGIMPQGREHVAICELLGVTKGLIALTKVDLADPDLLELVEDDVATQLDGTFLQTAPIFRFSARSIDAHRPAAMQCLSAFCGELLATQEAQKRRPRPFRLPVDRCFSIKGRGTVVTGTAASGAVAVGDLLRVWPGEQRARIREIERHGNSTEQFAGPGRVALNLARLGVEDVALGSVLAPDGSLVLTDRFDAHLTLLRHVSRPWKRRQNILLHIGTTQVVAAVTQLGADTLQPGDSGPVQIHVDRPIAIAPGEYFVVRGSLLDARHGQTAAGGQVLHPSPARHRLGDPHVLGALLALGDDDVETRLTGLLQLAGERGLTVEQLRLYDRAAPTAVDKALARAIGRSRIRKLGTQPHHFVPEAVELLKVRILGTIAKFHGTHPDSPGMALDSLLDELATWLPRTALSDLCAKMVRKETLRSHEGVLAQPGFTPSIDHARPELIDAVVAAVLKAKLATPATAPLAVTLTVAPKSPIELELALTAACADGRMMRASKDYYVATSQFTALVLELFATHGDRDSFSTGDLKTIAGLTRKHLIPLAELLDAKRVTVRDPDGNRRFRRGAREALESGVFAI